MMLKIKNAFIARHTKHNKLVCYKLINQENTK